MIQALSSFLEANSNYRDYEKPEKPAYKAVSIDSN